MCIQSLAWSKSCPAPGHVRSILYFTPAWEPARRFMEFRNGALQRLSVPCPALGHSQLPGRWKMRFPRAAGDVHRGKTPWLWAVLGQACHVLIPQQDFQQTPVEGPECCGPASPEGFLSLNMAYENSQIPASRDFWRIPRTTKTFGCGKALAHPSGNISGCPLLNGHWNISGSAALRGRALENASSLG